MHPERQPVNSSYGAPMGRHTHAAPFRGRIRARRVRLNSGGYDPGGAYWGHGAPLYYVYGAEDGECYVRARSNAEAVARALVEIGHDNPPRVGRWRRGSSPGTWFGCVGRLGENALLPYVERSKTGWYCWSFCASARRIHGLADTLAGAKAAAIAAAIKES